MKSDSVCKAAKRQLESKGRHYEQLRKKINRGLKKIGKKDLRYRKDDPAWFQDLRARFLKAGRDYGRAHTKYTKACGVYFNHTKGKWVES